MNPLLGLSMEVMSDDGEPGNHGYYLFLHFKSLSSAVPSASLDESTASSAVAGVFEITSSL